MTEHFSLAELESHRLCQKHGLSISQNSIPERPDREQPIATLADWVRGAELLEQARQRLGMPIVVTCGYRSPRLNTICGGVPTSQHQGFYWQKQPDGSKLRIPSMAFDLQTPGKLPDLFNILLDLPHDQILFETSQATGTQWLHWSWNPFHKNRHMHVADYQAG